MAEALDISDFSHQAVFDRDGMVRQLMKVFLKKTDSETSGTCSVNKKFRKFVFSPEAKKET